MIRNVGLIDVERCDVVSLIVTLSIRRGEKAILAPVEVRKLITILEETLHTTPAYGESPSTQPLADARALQQERDDSDLA